MFTFLLSNSLFLWYVLLPFCRSEAHARLFHSQVKYRWVKRIACDLLRFKWHIAINDFDFYSRTFFFLPFSALGFILRFVFADYFHLLTVICHGDAQTNSKNNNKKNMTRICHFYIKINKNITRRLYFTVLCLFIRRTRPTKLKTSKTRKIIFMYFYDFTYFFLTLAEFLFIFFVLFIFQAQILHCTPGWQLSAQFVLR